MLLLLTLGLVSPARACSCARPPFDVVGATGAVPHQELLQPAPDREPDLVVPPSPVLTLTRMTRSSGFLPETVAGTARFVRLDTGAVIGAITIRRRSPQGFGQGYVQLDVRPARPLEVGATYAIEMWSHPGSRRPDWYGVRLEVTADSPPSDPIPHELEWQYTPPHPAGMCFAPGWTLYFGDPHADDAWRRNYDLFMRGPGTSWQFWGTLAGPLIGNRGYSCSNYAFGSTAPIHATSLRVVPRDLSGQLGEPVELALPARPKVEQAEDWWYLLDIL